MDTWEDVLLNLYAFYMPCVLALALHADEANDDLARAIVRAVGHTQLRVSWLLAWCLLNLVLTATYVSLDWYMVAALSFVAFCCDVLVLMYFRPHYRARLVPPPDLEQEFHDFEPNAH